MTPQASGFLQQLALQTQVLAGLQWLCESQILACIPLDAPVTFVEVADISNVSVDQLQRVVRLMATAGFLCEPNDGHVAHTPLSAAFVTEPALLDAALYLSRTAVPVALKMPPAVQPSAPSDTAQPKAQRQFAAYMAHGILDEEHAVDELLKCVDWNAFDSATVVDVHPPSMATVVQLAALAPALQFVVQPVSAGGPSWTTRGLPPAVENRISVQPRTAAVPQTVLGSAVYILRLASLSPQLPWATIRSQTMLELRAHLHALRAQPASRLLLTALVLPRPGDVDHWTDAMVRLRDLSLLQLSNDRQPSKPEIVDLVTSVRDSAGSLVLSNETHAPRNAVLALEVRYEADHRRADGAVHLVP
ncbi:hypothetical protein PHISP_00383 [Aspergillus sp. HF37]|nr:hypothetical protein PHISP_00383 [Aspergillus sp. HF37]